MCGINAIFAPDGSVDAKVLQDMLNETVHRGEDATGYEVYDKGVCGIGINRLSIMDLETGMQPLHSSDQLIHTVFNGMIYNTLAIRSDLESRKTLATGNDGEIIPHLYEEMGPEFVRLLDGMFAIVIYDSSKKTFFAARDPVGIKPLYYLAVEDKYYFSSEVKSFLRVPEADAHLKNVHLIPPGHYLCPHLNDGHPIRFTALSRLKSIPDPIMVNALITHAVKKRMLADVEVGCFLSGGIDSSIVTAVAARFKPDIVAITVGHDGQPDVEAAKKVAAMLGVRHIIQDFTDEELIHLIPEAVRFVESYNPCVVTGAAVTMLAAKAAKAAGCKVALCGEGADEAFGGYLALREKEPGDLEESSWLMIHNINNTECKRLDRSTMAVSLEARTPFLDMKVLEYALNLPAAAKIHTTEDGRRIEKHILREAFDGYLPNEVLWREKCPFDQGSGARSIIEKINAMISEEEYLQLRAQYPLARIESREMAYYFKIFRDHFGDVGGDRVFTLFGEYPVLHENMMNRTSSSGS